MGLLPGLQKRNPGLGERFQRYTQTAPVPNAPELDPTRRLVLEGCESDAALDANAASQHLNDAAAKLESLIKQTPDVGRYGLVL